VNKDKNWWREPLLFSGKISGWIVAPIIGALFLGKYLDKKYDSDPIFFLGLTILAFIISCAGLVRITLKYIKDLEKKQKNNHD